jgi:clan AA aspartic protease
MGQVKIQVSLTSAFEDSQARRGLIERANVHFAQVMATVDTGAVNCVLPPFVADELGLARPFRQVAEYADGRREEVDVTEPVLIEIEGRKVYEECLVLGDEVRIGQTALEKTDLHVDCREGRLLPNPEHPHQPVVKVK